MVPFRISLAIYCTVVIVLAVSGALAQDVRCYECTSYMNQCRDTVDTVNNMVFKTRCKSKCYARTGEDGAIYRGCFSYFEDATGLKYDYTGCHNQTWNNKNLVWCLCDHDLCNGQSMEQIARSGSGYADYNPGVNNVYNYDNYDNADYVHDNEETKMMPNDDVMEGFAKESNFDDTYQEPYVKLLESGYGNAYQPYEQKIYYPYEKKHVEMDYRNRQYPGTHSRGTPYDMVQYSRSDDFRDVYPQTEDVKRVPYDPYGATGRYDQWRGDYYYDQNRDTARQGYDNNLYPEPEKQEEMSRTISPELASQIRCSETGYYQNPHDCRQFIACLLDPHSNTPIMHLMRCPSGLVFDNIKKICLTYSSTCNSGGKLHDYKPHPNSILKQSSKFYGRQEPEVEREAKRAEDVVVEYDANVYYNEKKIDTSGYSFGGGQGNELYDREGFYRQQQEGMDNLKYENENGYDTKYDDYDITVYNGEDYGPSIYEQNLLPEDKYRLFYDKAKK